MMRQPSKRVYLMRHGDAGGESQYPRVASWSDAGILSDARASLGKLADGFASTRIAAIYTSDIRRCVETAAIIAARAGLQPTPVRQLREICLGDCEGMTVAQLYARCPRFLEDLDAAPPGGESVRAVWKRASSWYQGILSSDEAKEVVIVAHGVVCRVVLAHVMDIPLEHYARIEQDAGCLNIIDYYASYGILKLLNYTCYDVAKRSLLGSTLHVWTPGGRLQA